MNFGPVCSVHVVYFCLWRVRLRLIRLVCPVDVRFILKELKRYEVCCVLEGKRDTSAIMLDRSVLKLSFQSAQVLDSTLIYLLYGELQPCRHFFNRNCF